MRKHTTRGNVLHSLIAFTVLAAAAGTRPGGATTYVRMSDAALADRAAIIVEARVMEIDPSPDGVRISTDYTMRVDRVLKGEVDGSTIVVRVPGGRQPSGVEARVAGAPVLESGERALLFLRPTRQAVYAIEQLMLGAFHRIEAGGSAVWVRDVSEAHLLRLEAGESASANDTEAPRQAKRFSNWLAARARGEDPPASYRIATVSGELRAATEEFRLQMGNFAPLRWFAFDEGRPVNWATFSAGQAGLPGGGHEEFQAAIAAWNADPDTNVAFGYSGQTAVNSSFEYYGGPDGLNAAVFDDHNLPRFDCAAGGLVSASVVYVQNWTLTSPSRGHQFHVIREADIGTSPGISCLFESQADPVRRSKLAEEVFGHELGHALGLADSSLNPKERDRALRAALMYPYLHGDGRGALLTADDRQGLRQLYGEPSRVPCRQEASTLCLQNGRFAVEASFWNPYDDSYGIARTIRVSDAFGLLSFYGPANIEAGIKIVKVGDSWRIFYGKLTDLQVNITVFDGETFLRTSLDTEQCSSGKVIGDESGAGAWDYSRSAAISPARGCTPGRNALCLLGGRFRAELSWHNQFNDTSGEAKMIRQSDVAGLAYYTDRGNIEMLIKVLELNGEVKLFYTPLSDLEYNLRLTDLATGVTRTYRNGETAPCRGLVF